MWTGCSEGERIGSRYFIDAGRTRWLVTGLINRQSGGFERHSPQLILGYGVIGNTPDFGSG